MLAKWIVVVALAFAAGAACAIGAATWLSGGWWESAAVAGAAAGETAGAEQPRAIAIALQALEGEDTLTNILLPPSDFQQTLALYARLVDADRETLERLLDEAEHLQPRRDSRAAQSIIYSRYAELDPNAAVERIIAAGLSERYVHLLEQVFRKWAKYDRTAALRRAETLPAIYRGVAGGAILSVSEDALPEQRDEIAATFGLRGQLEHMQADEAMRDSPAIAWQQALAAPPGPHRIAVLMRIANGWAERDPQQALTAIAELPQADLRQSMRSQLMVVWAMRDRRAARAWVDALPTSKERTEMAGEFAFGLAQEAPQDALDFVLTLASSERSAAARGVFSAWAGQDPRAAAEALATLGDAAIVESSARAVLQTWAHADPYAAFEWVSRQDTLPQDGSLFIAPLLGIAAYEPVDALDFALELPNGRSEAVATVLQVWARNDAPAAAAWLQQAAVPVGPAVVADIASYYADLDMDEAWNWLRTQPKTQQRAALYAIVPQLAQSAESLADVGRIVDRIDDADIRNEAIRLAAAEWVRQDPREVIRWLGRMAKGEDLASAQRSVFETWGAIDRAAAAAYVRRLRTAAERDAARSGLVLAGLHERDVDFAESMYGRIRASDRRREAAERLYLFWQENDPARAERYRDEAGFVD